MPSAISSSPKSALLTCEAIVDSIFWVIESKLTLQMSGRVGFVSKLSQSLKSADT